MDTKPTPCDSLSPMPWAAMRRAVFDVKGEPIGVFAREADARIVATAPELLAKLYECRAYVHDGIEVFVQCCTHPVTGLVTDTEDRLTIEADQDFLSQIDEVLHEAERPTDAVAQVPVGVFWNEVDAEYGYYAESEEAAHAAAAQYFEENGVEGQRIECQYVMVKAEHPLDFAGQRMAESLGEIAMATVWEWIIEEHDQENDMLENLTTSQQTELGQLILAYIKDAAKVKTWAVSDKSQKHLYITTGNIGDQP